MSGAFDVFRAAAKLETLGNYLSHQRDQAAATGDLQLAEDGMKMFFHRFETQADFVRNLLIAAPVAH